MQLQRFLDRHRRIQTNAESVATAKLCMVVIGALAGKSGSQAKLEQFLPYDVKELERDADDGMTEGTARVVQRLIRTRRLPVKITAMLADELRNYATPSG